MKGVFLSWWVLENYMKNCKYQKIWKLRVYYTGQRDGSGFLPKYPGQSLTYSHHLRDLGRLLTSSLWLPAVVLILFLIQCHLIWILLLDLPWNVPTSSLKSQLFLDFRHVKQYVRGSFRCEVLVTGPCCCAWIPCLSGLVSLICILPPIWAFEPSLDSAIYQGPKIHLI